MWKIFGCHEIQFVVCAFAFFPFGFIFPRTQEKSTNKLRAEITQRERQNSTRLKKKTSGMKQTSFFTQLLSS